MIDELLKIHRAVANFVLDKTKVVVGWGTVALAKRFPEEAEVARSLILRKVKQSEEEDDAK